MNLVIQAATTSDADVEAVAAILEDAARWLLQRGINQWAGNRHRDYIRSTMSMVDVYLAYLEGQPVGTLSLQEQDEAVWGKQPPVALYVHGLAVRRTVAGRGIGRAMIDWAAQQAVAQGKTFLRLDCMAENPALRMYYQQQGFTFRGITGQGIWKAALFEREAKQAGSDSSLNLDP